MPPPPALIALSRGVNGITSNGPTFERFRSSNRFKGNVDVIPDVEGYYLPSKLTTRLLKLLPSQAFCSVCAGQTCGKSELEFREGLIIGRIESMIGQSCYY